MNDFVLNQRQMDMKYVTIRIIHITLDNTRNTMLHKN
jgi:hypothetical protein